MVVPTQTGRGEGEAKGEGNGKTFYLKAGERERKDWPNMRASGTERGEKEK